MPATGDDAHFSFYRAFFASGAPRLLVLALLLSLGIGSVVSIVPAVLSDRFARTSHHYDGAPCFTFDDRSNIPVECVQGGEDAQRFAADANLIKNVLIFLFASIVGSMTDCRGRKVFLAFSFLLSSLAPIVLALIQYLKTMNPTWYYAADCSNGLISGLTLMLTMLSDCLPESFCSIG